LFFSSICVVIAQQEPRQPSPSRSAA